MVAIPIVLYWAFALWGLASRKPVLLYLFFLSLPFGSFAVVPPAVTAGLTFVPAPMTAVLLIAKTFLHRERFLIGLSSMLDVKRLGVLAAFLFVALVVTIFMPRLFAGGVLVVPVRGVVSGASPLYPTMQNVSQIAYLTISVVTVAAFAQILKTPASRQTALKALCAGAAMTIATGFLDFASQYVPIGPLLEPFRTATYALLTDVELITGKRVVGLMPEASSYGILCISMLCLVYFMRRAIKDDFLREYCAPALSVLLLGFAWLSTSSATYLGIALFLSMAVLEWLVRFSDRRYNPLRARYLGLEFAVAAGAVIGIAAIMLLKPSILETALAMIDRMVFQKTGTESFEERNMWTTVSLDALLSTYGVGVGIGATRASNSVVAVVSNVGVVGAVFYFGFIIQSLLRRAAPWDREGAVMMSALRYAFFPPFLVGLLIGTTADFGPFGALRYGLLTAIGLGGLYGVAPSPRRRIVGATALGAAT